MKELICIVCPKGCRLKAKSAEDITGNACPRGKEYAHGELINPVRMLTTTVRIDNAIHPRLPVKTAKPIPKGRVLEAMKSIEDIRVTAPVSVGDVIASNLLGTGVDLIACADL